LGDLKTEVTGEALDHLAAMAGGDARRALNALELAVLSTDPGEDGVIRVDLAAAKECMPRRDLIYDRQGDAHYDSVSAFIKSVRGSDVDAALYWLARMLKAGEDPRFIMRRLLILASEDIGLADPQALVQAAAASQALDWVGLPEGQYHLAQATIYLAPAPTTNSAGAIFRALGAVEEGASMSVPAHLRTSPHDRSADHPEYRYPHEYPNHYVEQRYLPEEMMGRHFYLPSEMGYEARIREWMAGLREQPLK